MLFGVTVSYGQADPAMAKTDSASSGFPKMKEPPPPERPEGISLYLIDTLLQPIPVSRQLFHDKMNKEQQRADEADGKADGIVTIPGDKDGSTLLTSTLLKKVSRLAIMVENMPANGRDEGAESQQKIQGIRGLWELLQQYNADPAPEAGFYDTLVRNMRDMIVATNEYKSLDFVMATPGIYTLDNARSFLDKDSEARAWIYTWMGKRYPMMMIKRLKEYAKDTFASAIIASAARLDPALIFNYSLSSNLQLKSAVYKTKDPYVQAIVRLATESDAPLRALPFLSDIYNNQKTIREIDNITADPQTFYNNLVRLRKSKEPLTRELYTDALSYNGLKYFVRPMNELHDTLDEVRFACIDSLPAESLYYLLVYGREEVYTSSFLGTFERLLQRMSPRKGNELLTDLDYDHFRTFIRLCAGYNTLSEFLATMDDTARTSVMSRFVSDLQQGELNDLEGAVDVADAIGSIKDTALFTFLQNKIQQNYNRCLLLENKKGKAIYSLLYMLMQSSQMSVSDAGAVAASDKLHIPPVNKVLHRSLANDTGVIYERVFFYGDQDGQTAYDGFVYDYRHNKDWVVDTTQYWTTVTSTKGEKVIMYANRPLKAPEDEKAIDSLDKYLRMCGIKPGMIIHRGHSYHVKTTLSKLDTKVRVVVLGSCGGYHNVATVLEKSPDAHIISSKQTGVGAINEPIVRTINDELQQGKDINWIAVWHTLDDYFANRKYLQEKYMDYVPPHKNLGVIFIKAYRQMMR